MEVYGYEIDEKNVKFKQEEPIIIRTQVKQEKNQRFPVFYFMNNLTGEYSRLEEEICDKPHQAVDGGRYNYMDRIDYQYDEVSGCIAVILVRFSGRDIELGKPKFFEEQKRFYVTPKKGIIYYAKGSWHHIEQLTKKSDMPFDITEYPHISQEYCGYCSKIGDVMSKLFNRVVTLKGNKGVSLDYGSNIVEFLMYKEPSVRKGPLQKKIDEYCSIELPEFVPKTEVKNNHRVYTEGRLLKLKDNLLCLQMFNITNSKEEFFEGYRMYITTDGEIINCKRNNYNKCVPVTTPLKGSHWKFSIYDYDETAVEGTILSYYKSIINDIPVDYRGYAVWCFINYPVFERLYKAGFKEYLNNFFSRTYDEPVEELAQFFGTSADKITNEKNIYKALGINKQQFDFYDNIMKTSGNWDLFNGAIIRNIKQILTSNLFDGDISSCDENTFKILFDFIMNNKHSFYDVRWVEILTRLNTVYGTKTLLSSFDTISLIMREGYYSVERQYGDYISMVAQMGLASMFKPRFSSIQELRNAHDNVTSLYNLRRDEFRAKGFKEALKRVEKYEYSNEQYSVIKPTSADDLVVEGNTLHHCVKNYIDRVAKGTTNIMFLRKTEELNVPFFTIEISNDGTIEQIHGLQNCNISTEPTIEPFIKEWIKAKKIKSSNFDKVR